MAPSPLSLLCALLLTLPLAIIFTVTNPPTLTILDDSATIITATTTTISTSIPDYATDKANVKPRPTLPPPKRYKTQHKPSLSGQKTPPPPGPPPRPQPLIDEIDGGEDDDNLLFQLASRVNSNPFPAGGPKKLAFMFLTTTPLPLAPLWELYFNRTRRKNLYNIYIHADPTGRYDLPFQGVFSNRTIPSKPTRRHSPTLIAAHRRLLAHALLHDPANYMFALVSSSCIPLHSFDFTYKTLIRSKKSFIEILGNEPWALGRWTARGDDAMLPEVSFENFRIGSQFSVLTRHHARIVVSDTRLWKKFKLPCLQENLHRCYPEENYCPTLLSMVDRWGCIPATLTYVDWKGQRDGHPHTFGALNVGPELIRFLRGRRPRYGDEEINGSDASVREQDDPFLFARKFGADTLKGLLDIADDVILRD